MGLDLRIKEMRRARGMSQAVLASSIGSTLRKVSAWERGETQLQLEDAARIADVFGCTLDELAGREWPPGRGDPMHAELGASYDRASQEGRRAIMTVARSVAETSGEGSERPGVRATGEVSA